MKWRSIVVLGTVILMLGTGNTSAEVTLEVVGSTAINYGDTTSIYVANGGEGHSYFYDGLRNVFIVDVTDPTTPTEVGSISLPGENPGIERRAAKNGDYLYIPRSGFGNPDMDIVNTSNPSNPMYIGSVSLGTARNLFVEGSYMYATGDGPISVYDVSAPSNPTFVWQSPILGVDFDIVAKDGFVYAVGEGPLTIIDTANQTVGDTVPLDDYANRAIISDNYLYVGDRNSRVTVFDISSPLEPLAVGTYTTTDSAPLSMDIAGDQMFIAGNGGNLEWIDISDPTNPFQLGVYGGLNAQDIYTNGNYIYAATEDGLKVLAVIPEPATLLLFGIGGLAVLRRRVKP